MANPWFRLWVDLPNDPKFRTIAKISEQSISSVIAVYIHMLCCASNATERGRTQDWRDEDIATALDLDIEQIIKIKDSMQGRLIDGDYLTGWNKRQPKREDGSAERAQADRERKKQEKLNKETQTNATERNQPTDKIREDKIREDKIRVKTSTKPTCVDFYNVPQNVIDDFKSHRKSKRASITQTVIDNIQSESEKAGISLADALSLCCSRGWTGFNADWVLKEAKSGRSAKPEFSHLGTHGQATAENAQRWLQKNTQQIIEEVK